MSTLGNRLREEREKLRITQEAFGKFADVSRGAQGRYESDERSPDAEYLARIAALGVDVLYVVTGQRAAPAATSLTAEEATLVEHYRAAAADVRAAASTLIAAAAAVGKNKKD
jgi:transcriptional regulator with XRE-family HTH domain